MSADARPLRAVDEEPRERRHFTLDGSPKHAELAMSALTAMHSTPVREEQARWGTSAHVHGLLAQREAMGDLARSNRELAAAMNRVAEQRERSS